MGARRTFAILAVTAVAAFGVACGSDDAEDAAQTVQGQADEATGAADAAGADGKQLFTTTCGGCHTLADAGTSGKVGPNLDEIKPDKDTVLHAINTGPGGMPENLASGETAEKIAEYVASAHGS